MEFKNLIIKMIYNITHNIFIKKKYFFLLFYIFYSNPNLIISIYLSFFLKKKNIKLHIFKNIVKNRIYIIISKKNLGYMKCQ